MDGPGKALAQLREALERALGFARSKRKDGTTMEPKLRAQLIEWEQRLEGLLGETVAAAQSGIAATPVLAAGLMNRAGHALHGFTQFAQTMLSGIGQRAVEGAKEGVRGGAKLAIQGAKGAGNIAEGLKDLANQAIEGAVEGAKQGAQGALKGLKNAAAAVPGLGGESEQPGKKMGAGKGGTREPGAGEGENWAPLPSEGQPGADQAGMGQPGADQAGMGQPGADQAGMGQPGADQAGMGQPGADQAGMGQPGADQAEGRQPSPGYFRRGQPRAGQPEMGQPEMGQRAPSAPPPVGGPGYGAFVMPAPVPLGDPVPIGGHVLPPLPYAYNALEPYIDEQTMRIHHDKHHQAYVDGLNKAEKALAEARRKGDYSLIKHWERELAFHGSGHYLHSIFWKEMDPKGGGKPSGELARLIDRDFGNFDVFKEHFTKAAEEVEGGGWAILVWAPRARRLQILQAEKHQNLTQQDVIPLLALDVWEHSYYLKYQNRRAEYVKNWWNVVNWPFVARRLASAVQVQWPPA